MVKNSKSNNSSSKVKVLYSINMYNDTLKVYTELKRIIYSTLIILLFFLKSIPKSSCPHHGLVRKRQQFSELHLPLHNDHIEWSSLNDDALLCYNLHLTEQHFIAPNLSAPKLAEINKNALQFLFNIFFLAIHLPYMIKR